MFPRKVAEMALCEPEHVLDVLVHLAFKAAFEGALNVQGRGRHLQPCVGRLVVVVWLRDDAHPRTPKAQSASPNARATSFAGVRTPA
jgi:hypothetical protein